MFYDPVGKVAAKLMHTMVNISRVPIQNGVSQALYIVEIHHSGRKPLIWLVTHKVKTIHRLTTMCVNIIALG